MSNGNDENRMNADELRAWVNRPGRDTVGDLVRQRRYGPNRAWRGLNRKLMRRSKRNGSR